MKKSIIFLLTLVVLASCRQRGEGARLQVSVTIEPLRWMTEQIGDTLVDVHTMVPAGSSPETYEPTPRQMVELSHSDIYIKVGCIGFETTWMERLMANAPQMKVVDASQGIAYVESSDGVKDPHTWTSCANARTMAANVCRALSEADAPHRTLYERNLHRLQQRIDSVDGAVGRALGGSPQRAFVIYHPALTYFARDYGLRQLPMEEEGREPGAAQMRQLVDEARRQRVKTIFVQREFSPRSTVAVRNATGAVPVEINPLAYDWPAQMLFIARALQ